jgi:O-antigen/teichoic acid export membrane protein
MEVVTSPLRQRLSGRLMRNIATNYVSAVWLGVLALALIPWYLEHLGVRRWGVVALCMTFQGLLTLLDAGLSQIMPRDIARAAHDKKGLSAVFRTFASSYLALAVLGFCVAQALAGPVVTHWIKPDPGLHDDMLLALRVVLVQFVFQFANNAHMGFWNGVQAQGTANLRQCVFGTAKHAGAATLVAIWRPDEIAYLLPFVAISVVEFFANRRAIWRSLPDGERRWATVAEMGALRREGATLALGVVAGMLLSQADRIFLSRAVDVATFGTYAIVATLGLAFMQLQLPVVRAFLPRLSAAPPADRARVSRQVALALMGLCIAPCLVLILVAPQILLLWTGEPRIAEAGSTPLRLILAAVALNALYQVRYLNLLVCGRSTLILVVNVVSMALVLPAAPWIVASHGIAGGGMIWVCISSLQICVSWAIMKVVSQ